MSSPQVGSSTPKVLPRGPIAWMTRNTVAANLLMVIFLVGGLMMSGQIRQEVFPEFTTDIVRISVPYPGASPEEVEQGIILSVEDVVRGLEGVKRVTSSAAEGSGSVIVELLSSANEFKTFQDIKNEVDRITSFPEDAERPVVSLVESRRKVITLVVYGEQTESALRGLAERIRDDLVHQPGITLVELGLTPPLEIAVEVPQEQLRAYGLTLEDIARKIRETAIELPAGEVRTEGGQVLLRTKERRDFGREFLDIPISANADGSMVRLADIAVIKDGFEEVDREAKFNGKPAITVEVYRVGDETPQSVSASVNDYIARIKKELPPDVGISIWDDRSTVFKDRMGLLMKNAALGLTLVLVLLGVFLEVRLAFWVTLGIPVSVLGCFLFLPSFDASINMISLFAFIITLGIIVDDAVVTGENIYEKREQGMAALPAAVVGAREIAMPVVFAVLTNIVAFMPLFFVPGISGKFFRQIPAVVVAVFIISLVESLFILPAHLSHEPKDNKFWRAVNRPRDYCAKQLEYFIEHYYDPFIAWVVGHRYITIAISISVLMLAVGVVKGNHLQFSFMPKIDADLITAQATMAFGVPLEESRRVEGVIIAAAERAVQRAGGPQIVKGIYSQVGGALVSFGPGPAFTGAGGSHIIASQVSLVSSELRSVSGTEFARIWREEVGQIVGLESLVFKAETGASEGQAIEFNLSHSTTEVLEAAAQDLRVVLEGYAGVSDIDDGVPTGKRQFSFTVTPYAESLGVTASILGRQIRSAFFGSEALRQQRGRNEVKVRVKLPESERSTLDTLSQLMVRTPRGGELPFSEAAQFAEGVSYTEIKRINGRRVITVSADVDSEVSNANDIIRELQSKVIPDLQAKYPGLTYSFGGEKEAQQDSLGSLGIGFAIAMLVIYALLAIPFKSYVQPAIVMLSIPFGFIGAIAGHFMLGYGLSIISMFGLIALSGVVVNDSLVLVVTANRFRETGMSALDAVINAGKRRLRPILLTSLTTFFGLAPMIFETSLQARFLIPMAISIGFGILFATVIILAIVPAFYLAVEDVKAYFAKRTPSESPVADPLATP
ncbi:MAG: efflux RND transporter permease subunit [Bdellovibrionales bacterium]|nr:efflux RND transporter permease subunit [Bdellovibrionales bacterium]